MSIWENNIWDDAKNGDDLDGSKSTNYIFECTSWDGIKTQDSLDECWNCKTFWNQENIMIMILRGYESRTLILFWKTIDQVDSTETKKFCDAE